MGHAPHQKTPSEISNPCATTPLDADNNNGKTIVGFACRDDVQIAAWPEAPKNGDSGTMAGEDTPRIIVEDGNGAAVHTPTEPCPTTTPPAPHTERTDAAASPRRRRAYTIVTTLAAVAATTATWLVTTEPVRVSIGIGALIVILAQVLKPRKQTNGAATDPPTRGLATYGR